VIPREDAAAESPRPTREEATADIAKAIVEDLEFFRRRHGKVLPLLKGGAELDRDIQDFFDRQQGQAKGK
jgi:hypothetical protein